ncbi:MAG: SIMPL domain-containing protein [Firmicutes bacterium]|nr:SIMPL domain-containing protein [Bacillota bacterium]
MKKNRLFLMICVLVLLLTSNLSAKTTAENSGGSIRVAGNSIASAAPDVAYIALGVETRDRSAETASSQNSQIMSDIMKTLKKFGLKDNEITTSGYYIYSYQESDRTQEPIEYYYVYNVRNQVNVKVTDLENVGTIIDLAIKAGANQVQGITFDIKNKEDLQLNALKNATRQAREKADAIAEAAGVTIKNIVSISEQTESYVPYTEEVMFKAAGNRLADTPINPGDVEVKARVVIEYSF